MDNGFFAKDFVFSLRALKWGPWSFSFPERGIVGVVGPNGAGKTSWFQVLLGEPAEACGSLRFGQHDLLNVPAASRRDLWATIPQESPYPEDWTVDAAVSLAFLRTGGVFARACGPTAEEDAAKTAALYRLGLAPLVSRRLSQLSSGQRQRVFLCRALLQKSRGILLDEPTNHLDPPARRQFWGHLKELSVVPGSPLIIVATHEMERLQETADHILALSGTRELVYAGPAALYWKMDWFSRTFGTEA